MSKAIGAVAAVIFAAIGVCGCGPAEGAGQQLAAGGFTHFGDYDWYVLDVQGNRALLLSEDVVETRPYNTECADVTWEDCTLRAYLNGAFYESFGKEERARIALTRNENPDNTWGGWWEDEPFGTPGGNPTDDRVFLLSVEEILKYYPGLKLYREGPWAGWRYEADARLVTKSYKSRLHWWLRSPGGYQGSAAVVSYLGSVDLGGFGVYNEGGVRPALWLNL